MKKQKSLNNKGFSLVELIIVIAIMAILVGVLAPSLLRYVEKTNVSADTQLADAVRTAVITAMMDPAVINSGDTSAVDFEAEHGVTNGSAFTDTSLTASFLTSLTETLGLTSTTGKAVGDELVGMLRSTHGTGAAIVVEVTTGGTVIVTITETDNTGGKDDASTSAGNDITVG